MAFRMLMAFVVLVPAAVCAGTLTPRDDEGQIVNAIVALVNGKPVTMIEVDRVVAALRRARPDVSPEDDRKNWQKAREILIEQQLLIQEARRQRIEVPPELVNHEIERYKRMGKDMERYRDRIREQLMVLRMLRKLEAARAVTPQEVAQYYEQHPDEFVLPERRRVCLIAIHSSELGDDKAAAKSKAAELLERLNKGEDFAALAKKHSHGAHADKGGDCGWLEKGSLRGALDSEASKLKPGEISGLVETPDGYAILKVVAVQPQARQSLTDARTAIRKRLKRQHDEAVRDQLLDRLRRSASIVRLDLAPRARKRP